MSRLSNREAPLLHNIVLTDSTQPFRCPHIDESTTQTGSQQDRYNEDKKLVNNQELRIQAKKILREHLHPSLNHGLLACIGLAGSRIGTRIFRSNISSPLGGLETISDTLESSSDTKRGITTPHSQFRQVNLGCFVTLS
jgi:hypothetical protein